MSAFDEESYVLWLAKDRAGGVAPREPPPARHGTRQTTRGNGYRDHDRHEFLLERQGYGTVNAYRDVHPERGHRCRASYGQVCMERAFPDRGPGAG